MPSPFSRRRAAAASWKSGSRPGWDSSTDSRAAAPGSRGPRAPARIGQSRRLERDRDRAGGRGRGGESGRSLRAGAADRPEKRGGLAEHRVDARPRQSPGGSARRLRPGVRAERAPSPGLERTGRRARRARPAWRSPGVVEARVGTGPAAVRGAPEHRRRRDGAGAPRPGPRGAVAVCRDGPAGSLREDLRRARKLLAEAGGDREALLVSVAIVLSGALPVSGEDPKPSAVHETSRVSVVEVPVQVVGRDGNRSRAWVSPTSSSKWTGGRSGSSRSTWFP